jgi:hypothetical protein
MARMTPAEAREKWARRLNAAIPDITAGVERVTEAPGKKAAAKSEKMLQGITAAVRDGTWARRVAGVSLEEWKRKMLDKGVGRIAAGVEGASAKSEDFFAQLFSYQDSIKAKLDSMPDLTLEDSINRMTAWVRDMAKFSKK